MTVGIVHGIRRLVLTLTLRADTAALSEGRRMVRSMFHTTTLTANSIPERRTPERMYAMREDGIVAEVPYTTEEEFETPGPDIIAAMTAVVSEIDNSTKMIKRRTGTFKSYSHGKNSPCRATSKEDVPGHVHKREW